MVRPIMDYIQEWAITDYQNYLRTGYPYSYVPSETAGQAGALDHYLRRDDSIRKLFFGEFLNSARECPENRTSSNNMAPDMLEKFQTYLNAGRDYPEKIIAEQKIIEKTSLAIAGFMLAATGAFLITPELTKNFFSWIAE